MTALFFGTYNAKHAANALLAQDLGRAGFEVRACHEPLWEKTRDKDAAYFGSLGLLRLAARYLGATRRLARRFAEVAGPSDLCVAGFNGQLDVLLLRRLAGLRPILFAPLVTVSETLIDDRQRYQARSTAGRLLGMLDRASLHAGDLILVDTSAHRDWISASFGLEGKRLLVQYLGAEAQFAPGTAAAATTPLHEGDDARRSGRLDVLFYGQYLPLHGADVIARAACLLRPEEGIDFELVGTGPERAAVERVVGSLPHVRLRDWIEYEALPARLARADVVLGIFGRSQKARMVVPNKVYQAASVGRAIVTATTPAIAEVFRDGESIVAIAPEPEALAETLRVLARSREQRERLGERARDAVDAVAGPAVRSRRLADGIAGIREPAAARGGARR